MNLRRALIGVGVVAVLVLGGVFSYYRFFAPPDTTAEPAATAAASAAGQVDSIAVDVGVDSVSAEGRIVPARHAAVALAGSGLLVEIAAPEGATVAAGQPILRLDAADQEAALRNAQAALALAGASQDAAAAGVEAAQAGVTAAELGVRAAGAELALTSAAPRPEEIALGESRVALAEARVAAAAAAQARVLEGVGEARIRAAEADLRAAEAAAIPPRLRLEALRGQDSPDADDLAEAERAYNAALAGVEAARAAVAELQDGATAAQRNAAGSAITAATAGREAAQADLDLLMAGGSAEAVAVAEAGVTGAEAALAEARARLAAAEAAVARAEAETKGAEAAVTAAQTAFDDRTLVAPFAGTVADLPFAVGEVVPAGMPAAVVADLSGWLVETTDLTEKDAVAVAAGYPAVVLPDALPDTPLDGVVTDIGGVGVEVQGDITYPVTIRLTDPAGAPLRWGMTVFVTIMTGDNS